MKKILYTILFAITVTFAISSCTEEIVTPTTSIPAGGGIDDGRGK